MATNHQHHEPTIFEMDPSEVTRDVISRTRSKGSRYWGIVGALGLLLALGVVGLVMRLNEGDTTKLGYLAATFSFLFTTTQTAPLVSIAFRLVKNHWRRPIARASELFAIVGLFNLIIFIPLMIALPSTEGRWTIWIEAASWSPHVFDTMMLVSLIICGIGLLWAGAIPDFASLRDNGGSRFHGIMAMGWQGTVRNWKIQRVFLGFFGAFYFMGILWTHYVISSDFSMSLVPGWVDSIYPTFHALSGIQAALATMLVTAYVLKRWGGYDEYIPMETFWGISKVFVASSLLWFYFWWSAFITYWYGRMEGEQAVLELINFGPYLYAWIIAFLCCFVLAVFMLIWNPIRKNPGALASIGVMVLIGCFFDRIRLFVSSWSVSDLRDKHHLKVEEVPATVLPEAADLMIIFGLISGAVLVYMLASRIIPVMSIWEMRELRLYQLSKMLVRKKVMVLGKPE